MEIKLYGTWEQDNLLIKEIDYDGDVHAFRVYAYLALGFYARVTQIVPGTGEETKEMHDALDAGESVLDWEDGHGNAVSTLVDQL